MGVREVVCLAIIITLIAGCRGQSFSASARYAGTTITVSITAPANLDFECRLDNGPFVPCSNGFTFTGVPVGEHNVTVRTVPNGAPLILGPLRIFNVSAQWVSRGTFLTLATLTSSESATFQCQLDSQVFVPCFEGFNYTRVSSGQHTLTVFATSSIDGRNVSITSIITVPQNVVQITSITQTRNITGNTLTFAYSTSESFSVQCRIDGGPLLDPCPNTIDTSTLSIGSHTIEFVVVIDGVIRGSATRAFEVFQAVTIQFKNISYSVVEGEEVYTVTLVKEGEPLRDITVIIHPERGTAGASDYDIGRQIVVFSPGDPNEKTVQISVTDDSILEANETYSLQLELTQAAVSAGGILGPRDRAEVIIVNDDIALVEFDRNVNLLLEETGRRTRAGARIRLALTTPDIEIPISFIVETFDINATADSDYQSINQTVEFLPTERANEVVIVNSIDDSIIEGTEFAGIRIVIPPQFQETVRIGSVGQRLIEIDDDDEGDLELECYAIVHGDRINGRTVQVFLTANQPAVFRCGINNGPPIDCESPHNFTNIGISDSIPVTVIADTTVKETPQSLTCTTQVLLVEGELQVTGVGEIAVQIRSSKSATYRCKLNDREFVDCVDGQVFQNLVSGRYTLFIEANGTVDRREFATDVVGPISMAIGIDTDLTRAFAACFGGENINGQYSVNWRTRGDRVVFRLSAQTQGWVGIGFSTNSLKPSSDNIVGAVSGSSFFVDDRYAEDRESSPVIDTVQNVDDASASFANGFTTVTFSRGKITNDIQQDVTLDLCRYFLYAWGGSVDINSRVIESHGTRFSRSTELFCFPATTVCPEKFVCVDPGTPVNGGRSFTDGLMEDSVVTYTCNSGYRLNGTRTQTCVLSETEGPVWQTGNLPSCIIDVCPNPGRPSNGNTMGSDFSVGEVVGHTCNVGYVLVGADRRECQQNGEWSESLPSCVVVTVELANESFSVIEGNTVRRVCVVKNGSAPVAFDVTITPVVTSPIEANPNRDYDPTPKTVTFNPTDVIQCTEIDTSPDTILENTERFIAILTLPPTTINTGVTRGDRTQAPVSILDDDMVEVSFKEIMYTVNEGVGNAVVGIQVNRPAGVPFTINIRTITGTATVDDFTPVTTTVTFGATDTMQFINIPINDDDILESTERFIVELSVPDPASDIGVKEGTPNVTTVIINDNDSLNVRFKEMLYCANESDRSMTIVLESSMSAGTQYTVTVSFTPDSASSSDFNPNTLMATFGPSDTEASVSVPITNDEVLEQTETFNISLSIPAASQSVGVNLGSPSAAIGKITDDEGIQYTNDSSVKVDEGQGVAIICMRRTGSTRFPLQVSIDYTSISATERADFDMGTVLVMFAANQAMVCFEIPILEDDITEDNETFEISAVPSVGGTPIVISVCIRDNDKVIFKFTEPEFSGNETDRMAMVCVEKVGRNEIPVSVTFTSIISSSTVDNPATVVDDFTRYSATITYDRGSNGEDNIQCIEVPLVDDEDIEPPEEFTGKLTSGDPEETPDDEVPIIINDNDGVRVAFKRVKYFVTEGDGPVELCLEKLGDVSNAVTVAVSSSNVRATAPSDYTAVSNFMITFQPDETMKCFEIDIVNDVIAEAVENFTVTVVPASGDVGVTDPDRAVVCITDDDVDRVCRMENQNIFPFSITGSYQLRDVCEHTIVTTCMDSDEFTINVDYSEDTLLLARVGIKYNESKIVILEDLTVTAMGLGNPIGQTGLTIEYANQIFITQNSGETVVDLRSLGVKVTRTSSDLEIETSSGRLSGDLCGLCGRYGVLLYADRMTVADLTSTSDIEQFTNSWRSLPLDMFLRDEARKECGMNANDTIIGDPLFKVPIHVSQQLIDENPEFEGANLCYEIHGIAGSSFNLVSDRCTSVNALYIPMDNPMAGNIIGAIGITAIDQDGVCHRIEARLEDGCSAIVDGDSLPTRGSYVKAGIRVYRRTNRVRIAIPNCGNVDLVLWFICQNVQGQMMSKFVIARGVNLQPTSHGLVGQFWNVPIDVDNFPLDPPARPHYTVNVTTSNGESRAFVGMFYERVWDLSLSPCLYVGNRQGGPSGEFDDPNDSVLQGSYQDYEVSSLFSNDFIYSVFDSDTCGL